MPRFIVKPRAEISTNKSVTDFLKLIALVSILKKVKLSIFI